MSVSADVLGVCGRSDCHLRRAQRRMVRPQARAPLPPSRRRGSGSGPLADGTPPSPRHSSYVRRPHRLSVAGSDRPAGRAGVNRRAWSATGRETGGNHRTCVATSERSRRTRTDSRGGSGPRGYGRADSDRRQRRRARGVFKPRRHSRRMGALCAMQARTAAPSISSPTTCRRISQSHSRCGLTMR